MRKVTIILAVAVLAGGGLVNLNDSRLPQAWNTGPGQAFGDENIQVSMPKEAFGFNGTLLGEVVKPVAKEGWFTIKVVKVLSYSAANKTKVNVDALTAAWKGQYDWCAPAPKVPPCPLYNVGDMVIMTCFQNEAHIRYFKVTKDEPKPAGETPAPVIKPPPAPTIATSRPEAAATSQPSVVDPATDKLKLAQMYIDSKMKDRAKETLQTIIKDYPNTEAAKTAKAKLAELGG